MNINSFSLVNAYSGKTCQECAIAFLEAREDEDEQTKRLLVRHVGYLAHVEGYESWQGLYDAICSDNVLWIQSWAEIDPQKKSRLIIEVLKQDLKEKAASASKESEQKFSWIPPVPSDQSNYMTTQHNPVSKTFVCLANSRMNGGSCIAGLEWSEGKLGNWIRITGPGNDALRGQSEFCENGVRPHVMGIYTVDLLGHNPIRHQIENWEIAPHKKMKEVGKIENLNQSFLDDDKKLWVLRGFKDEKTDRVLASNMHLVKDSLKFIYIAPLVLYVKDLGYKNQLRAKFKFNGISYDLVVTDRVYEDAIDWGEYQLDQCCVTISLALEPYKNSHYKLIAAIVPLQDKGN